MVTGLALSSFDLFHVGHLGALQQAATIADELVIAVADDALVLARRGTEANVAAPERVEVVGAFFPDARVVVVQSDGPELVSQLGCDTLFVCVPPDAGGPPPSAPPGVAIEEVRYETTASPSVQASLEPEVLWPLSEAGAGAGGG